MQSIQTQKHLAEFKPLLATRSCQAAMMTLAAGEASDDEVRNEHPASQQWMYVISGQGSATIIPRGRRRRAIKLLPGMLVLIDKGELHRIKNTGREQLRTLNFYIPPAYQTDGRLRKRQSRSGGKAGNGGT